MLRFSGIFEENILRLYIMKNHHIAFKKISITDTDFLSHPQRRKQFYKEAQKKKLILKLNKMRNN
jgi:hypothetical protein